MTRFADENLRSRIVWVIDIGCECTHLYRRFDSSVFIMHSYRFIRHVQIEIYVCVLL